MSEFESEYEQQGVRIVAVNAYEPLADGKAFVEASALPFRWMFADKAAAEALGVKAVPTQILLDRAGVVLWKSSIGSVAEGAPAIRKVLDDALAAAPQ